MTLGSVRLTVSMALLGCALNSLAQVVWPAPVLNPQHPIQNTAARDIVVDRSAVPWICGHELFGVDPSKLFDNYDNYPVTLLPGDMNNFGSVHDAFVWQHSTSGFASFFDLLLGTQSTIANGADFAVSISAARTLTNNIGVGGYGHMAPINGTDPQFNILARMYVGSTTYKATWDGPSPNTSTDSPDIAVDTDMAVQLNVPYLFVVGTAFDKCVILAYKPGANQGLDLVWSDILTVASRPNDVYVRGSYVYVVGSASPASGDSQEMLVAKYHAFTGAKQWEVYHDIAGSEFSMEEGHSVVVDQLGNVYVAGSIRDGIDLEYLVMKLSGANGLSIATPFIEDGQYPIGGVEPDDEALFVELDSEGSSVFVTGYSQKPHTLGVHNFYSQDVYTLKLDTSLQLLHSHVYDTSHLKPDGSVANVPDIPVGLIHNKGRLYLGCQSRSVPDAYAQIGAVRFDTSLAVQGFQNSVGIAIAMALDAASGYLYIAGMDDPTPLITQTAYTWQFNP